MHSTTKRYKLVEGSESGHCCFKFTIVDTAKPVKDFNDELIGYDEVCETFDRPSAELVLKALNSNALNS